jgi:tRNA-(ms[2]io[6]A)-hydroxylase
MYGLKLPTDPRWVNLAEKQLEDILNDHAYCELKAASTGISLIHSYPDLPELVKAITPVVTEEWAHYRMVLEQLEKRGFALAKSRKDEYVNKLTAAMKASSKPHDHLRERLLLSAMIEARSCERFKLLSQELEDEDLRHFYKNLMISEAGHYRLFLDLAIALTGKDNAMNRWAEILELEAKVMSEISLRGDRVH